MNNSTFTTKEGLFLWNVRADIDLIEDIRLCNLSSVKSIADIIQPYRKKGYKCSFIFKESRTDSTKVEAHIYNEDDALVTKLQISSYRYYTKPIVCAIGGIICFCAP